ncbi:MAG: C1 family peptidase [Gallionella sp.]
MNNSKIKALLLVRGNTGTAVAEFKEALRKQLDDDAKHDLCFSRDTHFDADTETALRCWQASVGLVADGIAGPRTRSALGIAPAAKLAVTLDAKIVSTLFPDTRTSRIEKNLPYVTAALAALGLTSQEMICIALSMIRTEAEGFIAIAELPSHFNTQPGLAAFSRYEHASKLGNTESGDGLRFRGRGYVQLTGRGNYRRFGNLLGIPLEESPDHACAPEIAACLLATHLADNQEKILTALNKGELMTGHISINGYNHNRARFTETYIKAQAIFTEQTQRKMQSGLPRSGLSNVTRDPKDLRDRPYTPPPNSLPKMYPSEDNIKHFISTYTQAGLILDQGQEGACTGFGLACVINFMLWKKAGMPQLFESVSPRMLYHFARRFDEFEGENYQGSSCRGALKGWYNNGVCIQSNWPYQAGHDSLPKAGWDSDAIERTLGVYYRIDTQNLSDLQAAILEVGAIYVSAYTHNGWNTVDSHIKTPALHSDLPIIAYDGKPSRRDGHSFALLGFNRDGFVIQNSWGNNWGAGGFALISYADWLTHAMDAWVAALGVAGVISGRLTMTDGYKPQNSMPSAAGTHWWNKETAYQHSIILGNNGHVARFNNLDSVTHTLQNQACIRPDTWFRENPQQQRKRLVIYAHGGLNSEAHALQRAQAMGQYFLSNGCYPLFLVWKSGLLETIDNILTEKFNAVRAGSTGCASDWINDNITDPLVEKTIARPYARPLWAEMKENAELAAESGRGGDLLSDALHTLVSSWGKKFELHLIGHSAGAIILGRLLEQLSQKNLTQHIKSVHLYAPACTVDFANRYYAPHQDIMNKLYLDILSDQYERDDQVAYVYQKSLLYLVSNALEADTHTPLMGLANVYNADFCGWDGTSSSAAACRNWRNAVEISQLTERITIHNEENFITRTDNEHNAEKKTAPSHGGFDNNITVISNTLKRITGQRTLTTPVDDLLGF